jgi:hypothetical protein
MFPACQACRAAGRARAFGPFWRCYSAVAAQRLVSKAVVAQNRSKSNIASWRCYSPYMQSDENRVAMTEVGSVSDRVAVE